VVGHRQVAVRMCAGVRRGARWVAVGVARYVGEYARRSQRTRATMSRGRKVELVVVAVSDSAKVRPVEIVPALYNEMREDK